MVLLNTCESMQISNDTRVVYYFQVYSNYPLAIFVKLKSTITSVVLIISCLLKLSLLSSALVVR